VSQYSNTATPDRYDATVNLDDKVAEREDREAGNPMRNRLTANRKSQDADEWITEWGARAPLGSPPKRSKAMNCLEEYLDDLRAFYNPHEGWSREDGCDPLLDDDGRVQAIQPGLPPCEDTLDNDIEF